MKLVICLDENDGINFNGRRQSQDIIQRENLFDLIKNQKLFLRQYSYELYRDLPFNFEIVEDFDNEEDGIYLTEQKESEEFLKNIDTIICYFWNRDYPFDEVFDLYKNSNWKEIDRMDFIGKSHENITRVIYYRRAYEK